MFLGWLLSCAYPEGFTNAETSYYLGLQRDFHWLAANPLDWVRTIPCGAVLAVCTKFPRPTNAFYWVNTILFSINIALIFVLGRSLNASRRASIALALAALFLEVAAMRTFFANLQVAADPFFAELTYLGMLLALIGWMRSSQPIFLVAYAILGLAALTKTVGLSLLPLWICFAALAWRRKTGSSLKRYGTILASITLLLGPIGLWSIRNCYVYGTPKTSASGGCSLLVTVLPLLTDNDEVFTDKKLNRAFIDSVRACEPDIRTLANVQPASLRRATIYETYFFRKAELSPPFNFLAQLNGCQSSNLTERIYFNSACMFKIDADALRLALSIIRAHPQAYLRRVAREYVDMFSPLALPPQPGEDYAADPAVAYQSNSATGRESDLNFYPGRGRPSAEGSNKWAAELLAALHTNPALQWLLVQYYAWQFLLSHAICITALLCYGWLGLTRPNQANWKRLRQTAVVVAMLFLTVASNYMAVALLQVARMRYAIAGGDLELHLMFLIVLWSGICFLFAEKGKSLSNQTTSTTEV
jgi:hypothetical protein